MFFDANPGKKFKKKGQDNYYVLVVVNILSKTPINFLIYHDTHIIIRYT